MCVAKKRNRNHACHVTNKQTSCVQHSTIFHSQFYLFFPSSLSFAATISYKNSLHESPFFYYFITLSFPPLSCGHAHSDATFIILTSHVITIYKNYTPPPLIHYAHIHNTHNTLYASGIFWKHVKNGSQLNIQ